MSLAALRWVQLRLNVVRWNVVVVDLVIAHWDIFAVKRLRSNVRFQLSLVEMPMCHYNDDLYKLEAKWLII